MVIFVRFDSVSLHVHDVLSKTFQAWVCQSACSCNTVPIEKSQFEQGMFVLLVVAMLIRVG